MSFKDVFIPSPGYKFVCADYSQQELRIAAAFSNDALMISAFKKGVDLYKVYAASITNKPIKDVTKDERDLAKAVLLGLQFGLGYKKLAVKLRNEYGRVVSDDDVKRMIDIYANTFKGLSLWRREAAKKSELQKHVTTTLGKRRTVNERNYYTVGMNHPIQGSAAEMTILAANSLHKKFKGKYMGIVNMIHDEILAECREDLVDECTNIMRETMVEAAVFICPSIVINNLVSINSGYSWAEAKK